MSCRATSQLPAASSRTMSPPRPADTSRSRAALWRLAPPWARIFHPDLASPTHENDSRRLKVEGRRMGAGVPLHQLRARLASVHHFQRTDSSTGMMHALPRHLLPPAPPIAPPPAPSDHPRSSTPHLQSTTSVWGISLSLDSLVPPTQPPALHPPSPQPRDSPSRTPPYRPRSLPSLSHLPSSSLVRPPETRRGNEEEST